MCKKGLNCLFCFIEQYLLISQKHLIHIYMVVYYQFNYRDEWVNEKDLPIKYAGVSTCFRQEVGR